MKKKYMVPDVELVKVAEDIICTSTCSAEGPDCPDE